MRIKASIFIIFGALIVSGCASSTAYPVSGIAIGAQDQVKFMSAPTVVQY